MQQLKQTLLIEEDDFFLIDPEDSLFQVLGIGDDFELKKKTKGKENQQLGELYAAVEDEQAQEKTDGKLETNNEKLDPNEKSIVKGKKPFIMTIFGKPGEGKSALAQYVVYEKFQQKAIDYVMVISNSSYNDDWKWLPSKAIKKHWTKDLADTIQKFQMKPERGHLLIVLEDPVGSFPWDDKQVLQMVITHRHLNISWIINVQYVNKIPPIYRECATYSAIFKQQTERAKEALFQSYGGDFGDKKKFYRVLQETTGNYYFLFFEAPFQRWSKTKIEPIPKNAKIEF
jgi:hypothetical protein